MPEPVPTPEESKQQEAPKQPSDLPSGAPSVGHRQAFKDIKRQLTDSELKESGTQKVILDLLMTTEAERDDLKEYQKKYYESEKQKAVLEEKVKTNKTNEIMFGVGLGVGCAIMGLAPFFWDPKPSQGIIALAVGIVLALGATAGRICFK